MYTSMIINYYVINTFVNNCVYSQDYYTSVHSQGWSCLPLTPQTKVAPPRRPAPLNSTLAELPSTVTPRLTRWAEQEFPPGTTTVMLLTMIRSSVVVTMARTLYEPGITGLMIVSRPGGPEGGNIIIAYM